MNDFRTMYRNKSDYLKASDLGGGDVVVTIRGIGTGTIGTGSEADTKPVFYFEEFDKGLFCNKVNGDTIGQLYSFDPDSLIGQRITLFATQCQNSKGSIVPCIRVRPQRPGDATPALTPTPAYRSASANVSGNSNASRGVQPHTSEIDYSDDRAFRAKLGQTFKSRGFSAQQQLECVQDECRRHDVPDIYELDGLNRKAFLVKVQTGVCDRFKRVVAVA